MICYWFNYCFKIIHVILIILLNQSDQCCLQFWEALMSQKPHTFYIVFPAIPVIMYFCLLRYLTLNSNKALRFSSLIIKSSIILFVQENCCFTPIFWRFFVSAIFFLEKRVQNNFPKNRVSLLGLAHVYYGVKYINTKRPT